jgi:hypothetical protein
MATDKDRAWIKEIGRKLRDDYGDCPTVPDDLLELLRKLKDAESGASAPEVADRQRSSEPQGQGGAEDDAGS